MANKKDAGKRRKSGKGFKKRYCRNNINRLVLLGKKLLLFLLLLLQLQKIPLGFGGGISFFEETEKRC